MKRFAVRIVSIAWVFLLVTVLISGYALAKSTITIIFPKKVSPTYPGTINTEIFGKLVHEFSGGRIVVKVYPGSELYNVKAGLQALTQGAVQMMNPPNGHFVAYSRLFQLIEIPFIFKTNREFYSFLYGKIGNEILKSLEKSNIVGITYDDEGPFIIATKNRLITKPSDFKGLKIRTSGHPVMEEALRLLGASTVRIPLGEVYSAAQQGVITGCATTLAAYVTRHLYEVLPYVTLWPGRVAHVWVASKSWWDNLDPLDRYIISVTAKERALAYDYEVWKDKDKFVKEIEKNGGKYHELSPKELRIMRQRIAPLYKKLRKQFGPIVDEILSEY